jgi:tetratricopeptide (TPR) repeat protein
MKRRDVSIRVAFLIILSGVSLLLINTAYPASEAFPGIQSGVTGAVKGYVKDVDSGVAIEKAKIVMESTKSSALKYELETDKKGYYYKGGLTPGYYKFTIEKEGYLPLTNTVRVRLADTVQSDFTLQTVEVVQIEESAKIAEKGMKLLNDAKWDDAVKIFSEGIAEDPNNPLLFFYRGLAQENTGRVEEALEDYRKVMVLKPDFLLPYSRSGKIYARQQNYEMANEVYKKSVELGDKDVTTIYNYGVVLINLGKSAEAQSVFENLLSLDPDYADAYYHLGIICIGQGDSGRAKELLQKFLELDPENPNAPVAKKILESLG